VRHRLSIVLGAGTHDAHEFGSAAAVMRARTIILALVLTGGASSALTGVGFALQTRFTYSSGQPLSPAYEGWMYNADGSVTMYFGYMNTNWLQEFEIPIGPDNNIAPRGPAHG